MSERILGDGMRLVISTTYPEPALLAIARAAQRRGQLEQLFTTLRSAPWMERAVTGAPLGALREPLLRELARRSFSGLPPESVVTVGGGGDLVHRATRLLPRSEALAQGLEYLVKAGFDRAVASRLGGTGSDTVMAMFASARETLRAARRSGRRCVLHLVNNHPAHRNRCLRELALVPPGHHELVPDRVAARVESELELADLVLVPSRAIAGQLEARGIPAGKVVLQPYGVNPAVFRPAAAGRRRPHRERLCCLFVGSVSHGKGVRFLLEAARQLEGWPVSFLLIGPLRAPELLRDLPENARWKAGIPHGDVAEAMRDADLFVMPSVEDAYPLVTLEAMASGLPVIVSDHAGTSELITHGRDGLVVEAGNAGALVAAIRQLLEDEYARRAIGDAGRRRVEAAGSWQNYGEGVLGRLEARPGRPAGALEGLPA